MVVGLVLGPAILGRVAPDAYRKVFVGSSPHLLDQLSVIEQLKATGVTEAAIDEKRDERRRSVAQLEAQHLERLHGLVTAIVLALAAVMVVETLVDPRSAQPRAGLATARYALLAVWLALVLARPTLLASVSAAFLVLLLVMAILAATLPLRRSAAP